MKPSPDTFFTYLDSLEGLGVGFAVVEQFVAKDACDHLRLVVRVPAASFMIVFGDEPELMPWAISYSKAVAACPAQMCRNPPWRRIFSISARAVSYSSLVTLRTHFLLCDVSIRVPLLISCSPVVMLTKATTGRCSGQESIPNTYPMPRS